MGPIVEELKAKYQGKSIEFLTFDFTSDESTEASKAMAESYGVMGTYKKNAPQTGFALLYDAREGTVLSRFRSQHTVARWSERIDAELAAP